MIDYQELIDGLNPERIKKLLFTLGAEEIIEKSDCLITNTICHNEEGGSLKLYYYFNTHMFVCYTEEGAMNIFTFLKTYYTNRNIDYDWYHDIYEVILDCSNYNPNLNFEPQKYKSIRDKYKAAPQVELPTYPNGLIDCFTKFYPPEWLADGISKEAMDKFNIRYSITQNKIIIPHYNVNGELVGIRGRALDEWEVENVGKYMPVQVEGVWYSHPLSLNLYGLNETKKNIRQTGICYLFEAEKSVLQMESFDIPNCAAAVCGSQFNKHALKLLIRSCSPKEIVICFDKEEKKGEDVYFNKLLSICKKYNAYSNFSFVYDWENLLDMKDSPTDKGERTFKRLIEKRIKVR